ncbi:VOC family protein [Paenarthrobacter sp. NPDC092416]|uniref:VOC family protein n=1 Tax=Paenarthrobacter sp. NPDC092416 TaxID=3364386 RepID=UPI0037F55D53
MVTENHENAAPARVPGPRIASIMFNAKDAAGLAQFWSELLGLPVVAEHEGFIWLRASAPGQPQLAFQQVGAPTEGRRRLHLDIHDDDPSALKVRAEGLGAVFVEGQDIGDFHWDVMQDPEGNEFCIAQD